jgi:hypothetical protein
MTIDRQYAELDNMRGRTYRVHTSLICPDCGDVTDLNSICLGTGFHSITVRGEVVALFERPDYHPKCGHNPIAAFGVLVTRIGSGSWFDLFMGVMKAMASGRDEDHATDSEGPVGGTDPDDSAS